MPTSKPLNHQTDVYSTEVHSAVWSMYQALGEPVRSALTFRADGFNPAMIDDDAAGGFHPVFGLVNHFRSYDGFSRDGGVSNIVPPPDSPYRGDALSIPCYEEWGAVCVLQVSFHKGGTYVERLDFPQAPESVRSALLELLTKLETR